MNEDAFANKVVRDFVGQDGRLKQIPSQLKKRQAILQWLAGNFEAGKRYPEKQVNVMLKKYHEDYATLRRELVDRGYLARKEGVYWKVEG